MAGDEKVYSLDIHLNLNSSTLFFPPSKGGRGQKQRRTMVNFGIKIDAPLKEGQEINSGGGLR